ncbi:phasin family protein [Bradyrhizobium sp.]|jgi:hypothetical protein|uniref:phasin family protein n=1 Tax=Bradyrhizobium sp. TaxID=376 RepID=UPI003C409AB9
MPTTQEEKPAKPRQRSRKADRRNPKGEPKTETRLDSDAVVAPVESTPVAIVVEEMAREEVAVEEAAGVEEAADTALAGEVLPPEVRAPPAQASGIPAFAHVYSEYTRKSWAAGRFLVERLIAARSIEEAVEIQGEFAQQAYANLAAQSQQICELYGEWARQMFKPFEKFTAELTRSERDRVSQTLH